MKKIVITGFAAAMCLLGSTAANADRIVVQGVFGGPPPVYVAPAPPPVIVEPAPPMYVGGYYHTRPVYYDRHHYYNWHYWHDRHGHEYHH